MMDSEEIEQYHVYDSFTGLPKSGPGDLGAEWPDLAPGALAVDYGWDTLPGVERACSDFLADKPESATVFGDANVALVVKQIEGRAGG